MWLIRFFKYIFSLFRSKAQTPSSPEAVYAEAPPEIDKQLKSQMWAIGGGKGGVGKSLITLMLGASLTRWGKKVIIVDADLGGSNLNMLTGISNPPYTLADFMKGKINNIEEVALDTPVRDLKVICGADDILGMANPGSAQKARLFNHLKKLKADIILLDLGAGTSYTTLDFFLFARNRIIVMSPENTSLQNAYGFVKTCLLRKLTREFRGDSKCMELINRLHSGKNDNINTMEELKEAFSLLGEERKSELSSSIEEFKTGLVINMVKENRDTKLGRSLISVANAYLSLNPEYLGCIEYDKRLDRSINNMADFLKNSTAVMTDMGLYDLASKLIKKIYKESIQLQSAEARMRGSAEVQKNKKTEKQHEEQASPG
jgi:flagellar biosynthesis protein FlhG